MLTFPYLPFLNNNFSVTYIMICFGYFPMLPIMFFWILIMIISNVTINILYSFYFSLLAYFFLYDPKSEIPKVKVLTNTASQDGWASFHLCVCSVFCIKIFLAWLKKRLPQLW